MTAVVVSDSCNLSVLQVSVTYAESTCDPTSQEAPPQISSYLWPVLLFGSATTCVQDELAMPHLRETHLVQTASCSLVAPWATANDGDAAGSAASALSAA